MTNPVTPEDLFKLIGAVPQSGPWGCRGQEDRSGIYVVTSDPPKDGQSVVYIGRAKSVTKRLYQFYRHKFGDRRPHRGGQDILKLPELGHTLQVYWAYTDNFEQNERVLIGKFETITGRLPMANKRRG